MYYSLKAPNKLFLLFIILSNILFCSNISGYIRDFDTNETLIGANVYIQEIQIGSSTDKDGYFIILNLQPKKYNLMISYLGYETQIVTIDIKDNKSIDIKMKKSPLELNEIKVTDDNIDKSFSMSSSQISLQSIQLKNVPQIAEPDLFRTLQSLPGVLTDNDFSTGLIVRGGNSDQNLILLDGITVYNPSHLGGVFSNFILDAVKEADFKKGGFNAEYGGRLSSVLNVKSREGNQNSIDGKASVSLLAAQTTIEGPINNGAWLISARRTYFDKLFENTDFFFPYYFYDVQSHIFQNIGENNKISLSWYLGEDNVYNWEELALEALWKNNTFSINYMHMFNEQLKAEFLLAKSRFDIILGFATNASEGIIEEDFIDDLTFKNSWTYYIDQKTKLNFGLEYKDLDFTYNATDRGDTLFFTNQEPTDIALFIKIKKSLFNKLVVEAGIRPNYYSASNDKWFIDPRLNLKYSLNPNRSINFSIGKYHQFIGTFQDDYNPKILDAWFSIDSSLEPGSATQLVLGYEEYFSNNIRLMIETFYKDINNTLTYVEERSTVDETFPNTFTDLVQPGNGYAYGLEFFLHKQTGKLNGWVSYTYSHSIKTFLDKEYYTNWDRRHVLNIIGNYQLSKKWDINFKWTLQTGQPYTPINYYYESSYFNSFGIENDSNPATHYRELSSGRNSDRYPTYHRLDFGTVYHTEIFGLDVDFFLQIVNLYYQKNIFRYTYTFGSDNDGIDNDGDEIIDENDEVLPFRKESYGIPLLPSIGFTIDF